MKNHLRKEKNCLNCGADVTDRYCPHCGQENIETKETVGHLLRHFFEDITHYDSKFFQTIKDLLFKPGFLTKEYLAGKRTQYLNPIRTYVFISAVFFLFMFLQGDKEKEINGPSNTHALNIWRQHLADSLRQSIRIVPKASGYDSARMRALRDIASALDTPVSKTTPQESIFVAFGGTGIKFKLQEDKYNSLKEYDSVQHALSKDQRDVGIMHWLIRTNVGLKNGMEAGAR